MIHHMRAKYPVTALCAFFGISRAAYYAWVKRMAQPDPDAPRLQLVQEAYATSHRTYGYRRIQIWLARERGVQLNHKTVLRLMQKLGLRSIARRRRPWRLGVAETEHRYPNRLARDFVAQRPNEKWVTDITTVPTQQGAEQTAHMVKEFDVLRETARQDASITSSLTTLIPSLRAFRAAPLTAEDQARRAGQLNRFLSLVAVEYGRGVTAGIVTRDLELQEATTFRDGAEAAYSSSCKPLRMNLAIRSSSSINNTRTRGLPTHLNSSELNRD